MSGSLHFMLSELVTSIETPFLKKHVYLHLYFVLSELFWQDSKKSSLTKVLVTQEIRGRTTLYRNYIQNILF